MIEGRLDACVELGLIYKTNPLEFYGQPDRIIKDLWDRTMRVIAASREAED